MAFLAASLKKTLCPSPTVCPRFQSGSRSRSLPRCPVVCLPCLHRLPVYPYTSARRTFSFTAWRRIAACVSFAPSASSSVIHSKCCQTRAPRSNLCEREREIVGESEKASPARAALPQIVMQCYPPAPHRNGSLCDNDGLFTTMQDGQGCRLSAVERCHPRPTPPRNSFYEF